MKQDFHNNGLSDSTKENVKNWPVWPINSPDFGRLGTILTAIDTEANPVESYEREDDGLLVLTASSVLPKVDFTSEIRPKLDIKHYVPQLSVILGVRCTRFREIIHQLVQQMAEKDICDTIQAEVAATLFATESDELLSAKVQAFVQHGQSCGFDSSWLCALSTVPSVKRRKIGIARMRTPLNLGPGMELVKFVLFVLSPAKEKATKSAYETARVFGSLFMSTDFKYRMLSARDQLEVIDIVSTTFEQIQKVSQPKEQNENKEKAVICRFGTDIYENFSRRLKFYVSDYVDGVVGEKAVQKTVATTSFLYFACILPCIAFGVLDGIHTKGKIDAARALVGQAIGGLAFALFSGQPLVIIGTTALVSLYIEVVYKFSETLQVDFLSLYACVGLFNCLFLTIYAFTGISRLMKWSTRSIEEIFACFIVMCFVSDAFKDTLKTFQDNYFYEPQANTMNISQLSTEVSLHTPRRESSLLFLILMFGTLWLSVTIYNFNQTTYLNAKKREFLSDYALPIAVVVLSFIGTFVFSDVPVDSFSFNTDITLEFANFRLLNLPSILVSAGLGFALSLLFFMDQNISGQFVNSPSNKLKKGEAPHLDLFIVALINGVLSVFGLPWMHGILPHSPLHVRSLADSYETVERGYVEHKIVNVRETRLTGIFANIFMGLSLFLVPYPLGYIPIPVLDGLFLFCAVSSLRGNSMFERLTLIFTEQSSYPPNHYVRTCPQRVIHCFTILQVLQLFVLCFVGYSPWTYLQMAFPLFIAFLMPVRHLVIPLFVSKKYLTALDAF